MPVEVMSELAEELDELVAGVDAAAVDAVVGVGDEVVLDMLELM
jgi:hypothetical protein